LSDRVALVWDDAFEAYDFGPQHPLKPIRVVLTVALMRACGLDTLPNVSSVIPRSATRDELETIHSPEYVEAVERISRNVDDPYGNYGWGIGTGDDPAFTGMHDASARVAGASITAADAVWSNTVEHAFNPAGGLHHAMRDHASGFCIYNDPAIVCGLLVDRGMRVAYVDIDAHHGDGVQAAFYDTDQVLTMSLHQHGRIPGTRRMFFPGTGTAEERGEGKGAGYSINVALPAFTDDVAYVRAFDAVVPELVSRYRPDVLVTQQGIDAHFTDPLTQLQISTRTREHAVRWFADSPYAWVAMGGGGYDLDAVRRTWSLEFLVMLGAPIPGELHDPEPPIWEGANRHALDELVDASVRAALAAAW